MNALLELDEKHEGAPKLLRESYHRAAVKALESKEWQTARKELGDLMGIDPEYKDASTLLRESYYRPAKAAMEAGEWEQARAELEALLKIDAKYEDASTFLLESYYRPAKTAMEMEEWERARAELESLLKIDAEYEDAPTLLHESYYRPAKAAMEAGKWEQTRAELEALLKIDADYEDAPTLLLESYYRPAKAAMEIGEWEQARTELEALLQIDANYEDAPTLLLESYYRSAKAAIETSEGEKATESLGSLLQLDPDYRDATQLASEVGSELGLVYIPAGEFQMGSKYGDSDERPVHAVALDGFWLDRTEVTNAQYRRCVKAGACSESKYADDSRYTGDNRPVVGVDWDDARGYCQWAGKRLPTEAEWEYAARGPESLIYPWGDEFDEMKLNAKGKADGYEYPAPVGNYPDGASWCGALDMAGNVWEWVADWGEDYPSGRRVNPTGPDSGSYKALRGGSWPHRYNWARSANRNSNTRDYSYNDLGFRCARNLE